jgi:hypothetical protein
MRLCIHCSSDFQRYTQQLRDACMTSTILFLPSSRVRASESCFLQPRGLVLSSEIGLPAFEIESSVQWFPLSAGSLGAAHPRSAAVYVEPFSELHSFCEHHTMCALSQIPKVLATTTKICNTDGSTSTHVHSFNAISTPPYSSRHRDMAHTREVHVH